MNVRFYLSNDIKIALKSHFPRKKVIILSLCMQRCYGHHNVWFFNFIAWRYFTPRHNVI